MSKLTWPQKVTDHKHGIVFQAACEVFRRARIAFYVSLNHKNQFTFEFPNEAQGIMARALLRGKL